MKNINWTYVTILGILFVSCQIPGMDSEVDRDPASSFPTYFDSLEQDFIYMQDDDVVFVDKETQHRTLLDFGWFWQGPNQLSWSRDGRFIYFLGSEFNQDGCLYRYNLEEKTKERLSGLDHVRSYTGSSNGSQFIIGCGTGFSLSTYYFWDEGSNRTIDLQAFGDSLFTTDSTYMTSRNFTYHWVRPDQFSYITYPYFYATDSVIIKYEYEVVLSFSGGTLNVDSVINHIDDAIWPSINSDSTIGYYLDNYHLRVIDYALDDTTAVSEISSSYAAFTPNEDLIVYNQLVSGGIDIFIGSSVWNMYVYDPETRYSTKLFPQAFDVHSIAVSSSQTQLLSAADYWSSQNYNNIWLTNLDGSNQTLVSDTLHYNCCPNFRPILN